MFPAPQLESRHPHYTVNDLVSVLTEMDRPDAVEVLERAQGVCVCVCWQDGSGCLLPVTAPDIQTHEQTDRQTGRQRDLYKLFLIAQLYPVTVARVVWGIP